MLKAKVQLVGKAKVFVITCGEDQHNRPLSKLSLLTGLGKASREVSLRLISLFSTQDSLLLVTKFYHSLPSATMEISFLHLRS